MDQTLGGQTSLRFGPFEACHAAHSRTCCLNTTAGDALFDTMCPLRILVLLLSLIVALVVVTHMLVQGGSFDESGFSDETQFESGADCAADGSRKPPAKRKRESAWQIFVSMFTGRFLYRQWKYVLSFTLVVFTSGLHRVCSQAFVTCVQATAWTYSLIVPAPTLPWSAGLFVFVVQPVC